MNENQISQMLSVKIAGMLQEDLLSLTPDTIVSSIGISSIDYVKLLIYAETEFDISFEDEDLLFNEDTTFGELVKKIYGLIE